MMLGYIVGTRLKALIEAFPISTHNICFRGEIKKLLSSTPSYLELWSMLRIIAPDKVFSSTEMFWHFSCFSMKTYVVVLIGSTSLRHF